METVKLFFNFSTIHTKTILKILKRKKHGAKDLAKKSRWILSC
jgi:hypothetical protein